MKAHFLALALLAGASAAQPAQAGVNLLVNGGFEQPDLNCLLCSAFVNPLLDPATLPGWDVGSAVLVRDSGSFEGNQFILLRPLTGIGESLRQSFTTQPGQSYNVSFAFGTGAPLGGSSTLNVIVGGQRGILFSQSQSLPGTLFGNRYWQSFGFSFVADGVIAALTFQAAALPSSLVFLDAVSVTAVTAGIPEPATWAMMLLGFAGLGVAARRRKAAIA